MCLTDVKTMVKKCFGRHPYRLDIAESPISLLKKVLWETSLYEVNYNIYVVNQLTYVNVKLSKFQTIVYIKHKRCSHLKKLHTKAEFKTDNS